MKLLTTVIFVFILSVNFAQKNKDQSMDEMWGESIVTPVTSVSERNKLFDESNFGMFIHWGLYSHLAGEWEGKTYYGIGEWLMSSRVADISPEEYKEVAKAFNPTHFSAMDIAQLAKDAGMKYIIITSKHHEGFAMFDSEVSDFNIVDATPFGRDPMKELSKACDELGLGFGFYYSHNQDWTAPGGFRGPDHFDDGSPATFNDYFYNKCMPQVKEICTNYGDIDFIWFDTPGDMDKHMVFELADLVRELQPNAMMCSRIGYGLGDYNTLGDMEVPPVNVTGLWEACDTNNDSWSYAWYDSNFKGSKEILHRLISTVARGGTYLFNVGPNGMGEIPEAGVKFLKAAGQWIKKYPQVVYDAGASPWGHALPWGDVTTQDHSLFLSVFDWPQDGKLYLPGINSEILSAKILGGDSPEPITFEKNDDWLVLDLPYEPADASVSVIEVQLNTKADEIEVDGALGVYPNHSTLLLTELAEVTGAEKASIRWMEKFGEWKKTTQVTQWQTDGKAEWTVNVKSPGYYHINLNHKGEGRLAWRIVTDEGALVQNQQRATEAYQFHPMGVLQFKEAGKHRVTVSLVDGDMATSSLKSISIEPIQ